jgi:hypothetical protein
MMASFQWTAGESCIVFRAAVHVLLLAQGGRPGLDDLAALDRQLHSNLLAVKACPAEDMESLGLTFSVEQQLFGRVRTCTWARLNMPAATVYCMHPFAVCTARFVTCASL